MITINDDFSVYITFDGNNFLQDIDPDTGKRFTSKAKVHRYIKASGWLERFKAFRIKQVKESAGQVIQGRYPLFKQINATLGIYSNDKTKEIAEFVQDIREKTETLERQIMALDDIDALNNFNTSLQETPADPAMAS